jgi:hypothetical protein
VAKPNYSFEKRQRELAKKKKKEEKASRKSNPAQDAGPDEQRAADGGEAPPAPGSVSGPA